MKKGYLLLITIAIGAMGIAMARVGCMSTHSKTVGIGDNKHYRYVGCNCDCADTLPNLRNRCLRCQHERDVKPDIIADEAMLKPRASKSRSYEMISRQSSPDKVLQQFIKDAHNYKPPMAL